MSRIGRLPVTVPSGVDIAIDGQTVKVKGPKGELSHVVAEPITVETNDGVLEVKRPDDARTSRSLHGLTRSLINNMVLGVTDGEPDRAVEQLHDDRPRRGVLGEQLPLVEREDHDPQGRVVHDHPGRRR